MLFPLMASISLIGWIIWEISRKSSLLITPRALSLHLTHCWWKVINYIVNLCFCFYTHLIRTPAIFNSIRKRESAWWKIKYKNGEHFMFSYRWCHLTSRISFLIITKTNRARAIYFNKVCTSSSFFFIFPLKKVFFFLFCSSFSRA